MPCSRAPQQDTRPPVKLKRHLTVDNVTFCRRRRGAPEEEGMMRVNRKIRSKSAGLQGSFAFAAGVHLQRQLSM